MNRGGLRRAPLGAALAVVLLAVAPPVPAAAGARAAADVRATAAAEARARGLVYEGLRRDEAAGDCEGRFVLGRSGGAPRCTHGPDPAPEGVDVRHPRSVHTLAEATGRQAVGTGTVLCLGDGQSGNRVQAIYAVASDSPDRYASIAPLIPVWAADADGAFSRSAAATGADRHVRWVTNPDCTLSVLKVVLSPAGDDSILDTEAELRAKGFTREDRKYLVWMDAERYCGIAGMYDDDQAGAANANNGGTTPLVGRIDRGCWGYNGEIEAHELMHTLGGVQASAPNATPWGHCTDEYDLMCYGDGPGVTMTYPCAEIALEARFDCGHDDYFHPSPPAGSYLETHWNAAGSSFLTSASAGDIPPDIVPPAVPTGLVATAGDRRVALTWAGVGDADLAGYRVRRDGAVVATVASTSFADTGVVNGSTYAYTVASYDRAGNESLPSLAVRATPLAPLPAPPPPPPPPAPPAPVDGYRLVATDGSSSGFGSAGSIGPTPAVPVAAGRPVVAAASAPTGRGLWVVTDEGHVHAVGGAPFHGSTGGIRLTRPVVGMAATPSGAGYWLVASDGGIFAFGDARFFGSTGAIRLNQPIVGMAATPSGAGYWLVASDGGIFAFADAGFFGSTGSLRLARPIVGMAASPSGRGYRFVAADGGVFCFGDAPFLGSAATAGASVRALVGAVR